MQYIHYYNKVSTFIKYYKMDNHGLALLMKEKQYSVHVHMHVQS